MAAIRGVVGPVVSATSVAWPAGTAAGDLAVLWDVNGSRPDGWASITGETRAYSKRLTSADIANPLPVKGPVTALFVLSGAGGVGRVRDSEWCRIQAGGVGLWVGWKTPWSSSALAASTYQYGSTVIRPDDQYRHAVWARTATSTDYYSPGSVNDRTSIVSIEILPLAAPLAPVWVAPASGVSVDRTQYTAVTVGHQSAANAVQDRVKVVIRVAAGTWGSIKADGTIAAGDTTQELVQSHGLVQIAANQLTANTTYELVPYTHDDGGWSPAGPSLTLVARTPPTGVVTLTTTAGDVSPTVSVALTPGVGSEMSWEAAVAPEGSGPDAAPSGWSSGLQRGTDTSWQAAPSTEAVNGGSYVGWWRYTDAALRSAWIASAAKTVSWTPPAAPAAITAADGTPPTVTATGVPAESLALEWQWLVDDVWTPLTTTEGPAATEMISVPHAPYGEERSYRVRAFANVDGVRLPSAWVTSSAMASTDQGAYLISADGSDWLAVDLFEDGPRGVRQARSVSYGLGANKPRIDSTPPAGQYGTTSIDVETQAELDVLLAWLTGRASWIMRWPVERDPSGSWRAIPDTTMGLQDEPGFGRWAQVAITGRNVAFTWVEQ